MRLMRSVLAPVLCAGLIIPSLPIASASAAPLAKPSISKSGDVVQVQRRGRYGHRGPRWGPPPRYYYAPRRNNAGVIIGSIIAGALIASAIQEGRARETDMERCAARFRSFDWETGTYITYEGEERVCPYLY